MAALKTSCTTQVAHLILIGRPIEVNLVMAAVTSALVAIRVKIN